MKRAVKQVEKRAPTFGGRHPTITKVGKGAGAAALISGGFYGLNKLAQPTADVFLSQ